MYKLDKYEFRFLIMAITWFIIVIIGNVLKSQNHYFNQYYPFNIPYISEFRLTIFIVIMISGLWVFLYARKHGLFEEDTYGDDIEKRNIMHVPLTKIRIFFATSKIFTYYFIIFRIKFLTNGLIDYLTLLLVSIYILVDIYLWYSFLKDRQKLISDGYDINPQKLKHNIMYYVLFNLIALFCSRFDISRNIARA
jgi:hypothetical protein